MFEIIKKEQEDINDLLQTGEAGNVNLIALKIQFTVCVAPYSVCADGES